METPLVQAMFFIAFIAVLVSAAISGLINLLPEPMTNEQIIEETKKCDEADMSSYQIRNGFDNSIIKVQCTPNNQ